MLTSAVLLLGLLVSFAVAKLSAADVTTFLQDHNKVRSQHGAAPLVWSSSLEDYAQKWADKCNTVHSQGPNGENLFWGTAWAYGISDAVQAWASEASEYHSENPIYSHFTQVVWKSTTQLGCGVQICGENRFVTCEYFPPGNVEGQFGENVQA